jgi:predicted N-acetyltransferase YhbS
MEGPRAVATEEFATLRQLTDAVFRPNMMDEYPQLFNEDNKENLRVCLDEGRCVSHVGMTQRQATLFGSLIKVCCVGAVSTLEAYRGQGLASACFDDAVSKAHRDGVDFMIVSGERNLYRMRGCMRVGSDKVFGLTQDMLAGLERPEVTVEPMTAEELPLVMDCYRREPVRFLRPRDEYRYAQQSHFVMNRLGDFLVVREYGQFRAYGILQLPGESKRSFLAEFAGDRRALLAALPLIFRRYGLTQLHWQVQRHDTLFQSLCSEAGLSGTASTTPGTIKLINYPQLMTRLLLRWEELLGWHEAAKLAFWQQGDQYGFRLDQDELVTDRDTATRLLFGTVDGAEAATIAGHGRLTEVLQTILPLPTLWYGINYV